MATKAAAKTEVADSPADRLKLGAAAALVVGGLALFYTFGEYSFLYRVLALLVVFGIAVAIVLQTGFGRRTAEFFRDSRTEVRKVVWTTRAETTQTTLMVFIIVILVGIFLWLLDWGLSSAFKAITGSGG